MDIWPLGRLSAGKQCQTGNKQAKRYERVHDKDIDARPRCQPCWSRPRLLSAGSVALVDSTGRTATEVARDCRTSIVRACSAFCFRSRFRSSRGLLRKRERPVSKMYAFIEDEKTTHPVAFLRRLLKISRSYF